MIKMLLGLCFCFANGCLLAPQIAEADTLAEQLMSAIERLEKRGSYRWSSQVEVPEETRFRPGPTQGTKISDGMTHVSLSFGPRLMHIVIDGDKAAVTNHDGRWETIWLADQGYSSTGFSASLARGVQTPVEEAAALASSLTSLRTEDDAIIGTLPADTAKSRFDTRRGSADIREPKGTVHFSINDGVLTKYVVHVEAKVVDENQTLDVSRKITVELSDVGSAKLDLPSGATEAFKRPVEKSELRLSDAEATKLLSMRGKRDIGVHDPSSIVKCNGEYWFFSTGTGVSSWRSTDLQNWQRGPRVFPEIPNWVKDVVPEQRGHFWAPDIIQLNDRYLLYYSVSSFGKNTSAIALASTPTLNPDDPAFVWTDEGIVIQSNSSDDFNAIDPAVIRTQQGDLWMSFGSFWSGLKLIKLDPQSGKRSAEDTTLRSIANYRQIEAPHIYQHDEWFYLFVNWGKCCSGVDSTYNIRVGRSRSITGPYLDKEGVDLANGGGTLLLGSEGPFIGPGHANLLHDNDRYLLSCHYYDGTERGRSMLSIQELSWSEEGWPVIAK